MTEISPLSVSEITEHIRAIVESDGALRRVYVRGELSNYKIYPSGHHYFTLKDAGASIRCVMFRADASRLRFRPENGMAVICSGRVAVYPRDGAYQLYVTAVQPEGLGDLHAAYEQLKAKLLAEGLFAQEHKKPLPAMPEKIALITSGAGAAVQDMIRILGRRWPLAKVVLYPAQVQGQGAAESIARAIALANAIGEADVILCGRGGGSMEDLWAFNEEVTARAIFASEIPVISAVGHEPDFTIADFVADLRAPTPSGAAELAVPDRAECALNLRTLDARLHRAAHRRAEQQRKLLDGLQERLSNRTPMKYIEEKRLLLTQTEERLFSAVPVRLETERNRLNGLQQRLLAAGQSGLHRRKLRFAQTVATLDAMSPLRVLGRGYAVATKGVKHTVVTDAAALKQGDTLHIQFAKGAADCRVTDIEEDK